METFQIIAGIASILSFLLSIFIIGKVVQIRNDTKTGDFSKTNIKQAIKGGDNNTQVGGNQNV